MAKIIRLNESDLTKLVKRVMQEQAATGSSGGTIRFPDLNGKTVTFYKKGVEAPNNIYVNGKILNSTLIPGAYKVRIHIEIGDVNNATNILQDNKTNVVFDCQSRQFTEKNNFSKNAMVFNKKLNDFLFANACSKMNAPQQQPKKITGQTDF